MTDAFAYIQDPVARKLTAALEQCMRHKQIDQIRTSDILEQAQVSRSTFYRRYRDKYDMINTNYQYLLNQTLGEISDGMTYLEATRAIYSTLKTAPEFYKNALSSIEPDGLRHYIYEQSFKTLRQVLSEYGLDMNCSMNQMLLTGFISGTLTITCIWAEQGMKEEVNRLIDCFYELMPDAFRKCFFVHFA